MSSPESSAFVMVERKKDRAPKKRKGRGVVAERTLAERIAARKVMLEESDFIRSARQLLRDAIAGPSSSSGTEKIDCPIPTCVVCLGLGSLVGSTKSQDQLVLLQSLLPDLNLSPEETSRKPLVYDPVFEPLDVAYFGEIGMQTLKAEFDLVLSEPTLLYMPHCPRFLYDDLLRKNWSIEGFRRIVILGNGLDIYDDPASSKAKSRFIDKAAPLFTILSLPLKKAHLDVFNDTALQWISERTLLEQSDEFWRFADDEKPVEIDPIAKALRMIEIQ